MNGSTMSRRLLLGLASGGAMAAAIARHPLAAGAALRVLKVRGCSCCDLWVAHLRANGFTSTVEEHADLIPLKDRFGVPMPLRSCHTAFLDGYVIEGHVPAPALTRLLAERPPLAGLAVPGMPAGSPGMPSDTPEAYAVMAFYRTGQSDVFMRFVGERVL